MSEINRAHPQMDEHRIDHLRREAVGRGPLVRIQTWELIELCNRATELEDAKLVAEEWRRFAHRWNPDNKEPYEEYIKRVPFSWEVSQAAVVKNLSKVLEEE